MCECRYGGTAEWALASTECALGKEANVPFLPARAAASAAGDGNPSNTGYSPLSYIGNPGVNVSYREGW